MFRRFSYIISYHGFIAKVEVSTRRVRWTTENTDSGKKYGAVVNIETELTIQGAFMVADLIQNQFHRTVDKLESDVLIEPGIVAAGRIQLSGADDV